MARRRHELKGPGQSSGETEWESLRLETYALREVEMMRNEFGMRVPVLLPITAAVGRAQMGGCTAEAYPPLGGRRTCRSLSRTRRREHRGCCAAYRSARTGAADRDRQLRQLRGLRRVRRWILGKHRGARYDGRRLLAAGAVLQQVTSPRRTECIPRDEGDRGVVLRVRHSYEKRLKS